MPTTPKRTRPPNEMFWASLHLCSFYASYAAVSWQNQTPIAPLTAMLFRGQKNHPSYVNQRICFHSQKQTPQKPMDWILVGGTQQIWKRCASQIGSISPNTGVTISKQYLKPPPRIGLLRNTWCPSLKMFPLSPISVEVTANSMMNITALIRPGSCSCLWRFGESSPTISGISPVESRWRNSHVLVYHGPLLIHLLGVAPSTFHCGVPI